MRARSTAWASPRLTEPSPQLLGDPPHSGQVELGGEHEGHAEHLEARGGAGGRAGCAGSAPGRGRRGRPAPPSARPRRRPCPAPGVPVGPASGSPRRLPTPFSCAIRRSSAAVNRCGRIPLTTTASARGRGAVQPVAQLERLGHGHLGSPAPPPDSRSRGVRRAALAPARTARRSARRGRSRRTSTASAACRAHGPWPDRRAPPGHRRRLRLRQRWPWVSSQILTMLTSSLAPGAAAAKYWKVLLEREHAAGHAPARVSAATRAARGRGRSRCSTGARSSSISTPVCMPATSEQLGQPGLLSHLDHDRPRSPLGGEQAEGGRPPSSCRRPPCR